MRSKANVNLLPKHENTVDNKNQHTIYICEHVKIEYQKTEYETVGLFKCIEKAFEKIYEEALTKMDVNETYKHYYPNKRFLCIENNPVYYIDRWKKHSGLASYSINEWQIDTNGGKSKQKWYLNLDIMIKKHIIDNKLLTNKKVKEYIQNLLFERDIGRQCLELSEEFFNNNFDVSDDYINKWNEIYK